MFISVLCKWKKLDTCFYEEMRSVINYRCFSPSFSYCSVFIRFSFYALKSELILQQNCSVFVSAKSNLPESLNRKNISFVVESPAQYCSSFPRVVPLGSFRQRQGLDFFSHSACLTRAGAILLPCLWIKSDRNCDVTGPCDVIKACDVIVGGSCDVTPISEPVVGRSLGTLAMTAPGGPHKSSHSGLHQILLGHKSGSRIFTRLPPRSTGKQENPSEYQRDFRRGAFSNKLSVKLQNIEFFKEPIYFVRCF